MPEIRPQDPQRSFGGKSGGEKPKNFGMAIRKLLGYCSKYFPALAASMIFAATGAVLNLMGPGRLADMTNAITDGLVTEINFSAVTEIALSLVLLYAFGWLLNVVQGYLPQR